jgi:glyoxylase-like metal-dependent hydrolase (beta-lactamase superfamily II)
MKRLVGLLVVSLAALSCHHDSRLDLVNRAIDAVGGKDNLSAIKTIDIKGTLRQWEPEQSLVADGDARLAGDSTFETLADLGTGATRIDWVRNLVYPTPRTYTFSEIVTADAGFVAGIDATARNKQNLESKPPAHSMSGLRLAASQRELRRGSPALLLDMAKDPSRLTPAGEIAIGGIAYPALDYKVGDQTFTVLFDPATGLPARVRTLDYDNIWGDVTYDLVLSDWRTFDKIRVPAARNYELNGRVVAELHITDVKADVPVPPERISIPATMTASAVKPATGAVPYQWVIRRQFIGTYMDSDQPSYDARAGAGLHLAEVAPGVQQVVGGTHNSLLVEMKDHLIAFDAPVSDAQSNWTINAAREKFGAKPIKYLVLSHHHMDHAGGFRAYAAQGATLVVGKGDAEHFRHALAAPFHRNPDLSWRDLSATPIIEVTDRHVLGDGTREVDLYTFDNPHVSGMLLGYVADAKLAWVVDLWSPGRDPLPEKLTPAQMALITEVKKAGIAPEKFAAGHGSTGEYAPLAALEGK